MKKSSRREFIKSGSLGSLALMSSLNASATTVPIKKISAAPNKRDRMLELLDPNSKSNYIPAGFFMHFNKKGDEAVRAHLNYFRATDMDFVKVQFDGMSMPRNEQIKEAKDWYKMPILPESWFEPILYIIRNLTRELKSEAMIIQTIFSPYQMAKEAVPWDMLVEHVKQDPEAVCRGMENVALSIARFMRAAAKAGVDGFYTCSQGGETNRIPDFTLFNRTIKIYDMMLYKEASELATCNIMHLCDYDGDYVGFADRFRDYPGHVVSVPLKADNQPLTLKTASELFKRPILGGLDRKGAIATGSVEDVKKATTKILENAPEKLFLSANCTVAPTTPVENLKTAIQLAHRFRQG